MVQYYKVRSNVMPLSSAFIFQRELAATRLDGSSQFRSSFAGGPAAGAVRVSSLANHAYRVPVGFDIFIPATLAAGLT